MVALKNRVLRTMPWDFLSGEDSDLESLGVDYGHAVRSLGRWILLGFVVGLAIVVCGGILYVGSGNKTWTVVFIDLFVYLTAFGAVAFLGFRSITRSWLAGYIAESTLLSVTEISSDAVFTFNTNDTVITDWSRGAERVFGFATAEAVGRSIAIFLPDDFLERDTELVRSLFDKGYVDQRRIISKRKDGDTFPAEVSATLMRDPQGRPGTVVAVLRDTTEQVRMEDELKRSRDELEVRVLERTAELQEANSLLQMETMERRRAEADRDASEIHYRTLIENTTDLILLVDGLGTLQYISPSVERILGYKPEEEVDRNIVEFVHPDDVQLVAEQFQFGMENPGLPVSIRARVMSTDGSWRYLDCVGKNLTEDPVVASVVVTARDVTESREAEEQIRVLNTELRGKVAELRNVNSELESFSYSVSHDLRAPLRAVRGFCDMVSSEYAGSMDAEGKRFLEMIHANAVQMDELIESLLEFSRTGRAELRRGEVAMSRLAREVAGELGSFNGGRNIEFRLGDLPPADGDAALLRQVLVNLVSNAVKFTRDRNPAVVEIGGQVLDGESVYYVRDNGVGFDQRRAGKMFGVFQRLHSTEDFEGSGIGLALVQKIVRRHGGRVWAEGALGAGATVYFTIPTN